MERRATGHRGKHSQRQGEEMCEQGLRTLGQQGNTPCLLQSPLTVLDLTAWRLSSHRATVSSFLGVLLIPHTTGIRHRFPASRNINELLPS